MVLLSLFILSLLLLILFGLVCILQSVIVLIKLCSEDALDFCLITYHWSHQLLLKSQLLVISQIYMNIVSVPRGYKGREDLRHCTTLITCSSFAMVKTIIIWVTVIVCLISWVVLLALLHLFLKLWLTYQLRIAFFQLITIAKIDLVWLSSECKQFSFLFLFCLLPLHSLFLMPFFALFMLFPMLLNWVFNNILTLRYASWIL